MKSAPSVKTVDLLDSAEPTPLTVCANPNDSSAQPTHWPEIHNLLSQAIADWNNDHPHRLQSIPETECREDIDRLFKELRLQIDNF